MLKENDLVKTLVDKDGYKAGTIGTVASFWADPRGIEVEVWDEDCISVDCITYTIDQVVLIEEKDYPKYLPWMRGEKAKKEWERKIKNRFE